MATLKTPEIDIQAVDKISPALNLAKTLTETYAARIAQIQAEHRRSHDRRAAHKEGQSNDS